MFLAFTPLKLITLHTFCFCVLSDMTVESLRLRDLDEIRGDKINNFV